MIISVKTRTYGRDYVQVERGYPLGGAKFALVSLHQIDRQCAYVIMNFFLSDLSSLPELVPA